jgi:hypothetical protein
MVAESLSWSGSRATRIKLTKLCEQPVALQGPSSVPTAMQPAQ